MAGSHRNISKVESRAGRWGVAGETEKHNRLSGSCSAQWILHIEAAVVTLGWSASRKVGGKGDLQLAVQRQGVALIG